MASSCWRASDFLNREPDQSGLDFWTGNITACGSDDDCRNVHRIHDSAAFFLGINDLKQTALPVSTKDQSFFEEPPDVASIILKSLLYRYSILALWLPELDRAIFRSRSGASSHFQKPFRVSV